MRGVTGTCTSPASGLQLRRPSDCPGIYGAGRRPLGVGASSKPVDGDRVNFDTMSAAAASFVRQVRSMLADGSAEFGGCSLASVPIIGLGHSLGACLTVVTQAQHRCYDAVALLGLTHGQKEVAVTAVGTASRADRRRDVGRPRSSRRGRSSSSWDDVSGFAPREPSHAWLHHRDVPAAVIAARSMQRPLGGPAVLTSRRSWLDTAPDSGRARLQRFPRIRRSRRPAPSLTPMWPTTAAAAT